MSFSSQVKSELAGVSGQYRCCVTAELGAFILGAGVITLHGRGQISLGFRTDSAAVLKRVLKLFNLSGAAYVRPRLMLKQRMAGHRQYHLLLSQRDSHRLLREQGMLRQDEEGTERFSAPSRVMRRNCCRRAYLRGAFLASGYIFDPRRRYHAEWVYKDHARAARLKRVLLQLGLLAGLSERRGDALVTIKGGDQVSELLKLMGAHLSVLSMENSRAEKSLRERANRAVNCDAANLGRQLSAAREQIEAIEALSRAIGLNSLPPRLSALARLRLSQPDARLTDLGEQMEPRLSKSGIQHQMRKLLCMAKELEHSAQSPAMEAPQ